MGKIRVVMPNVTMNQEVVDFIETYSFPEELLRHVCLYPEDVTLDPSSADRGYHVIRMRRGDITVVVGLQDPVNPRALYVYLHTPGEGSTSGKQRKAAGAGKKAPRTLTGVISHLSSMGCEINRTKSNHLKVVYDGVQVGSLSSTPSDHRSMLNSYRDISRKVLVAAQKKELVKDRERLDEQDG